jgi:hypothetical protein
LNGNDIFKKRSGLAKARPHNIRVSHCSSILKKNSLFYLLKINEFSSPYLNTYFYIYNSKEGREEKKGEGGDGFSAPPQK